MADARFHNEKGKFKEGNPGGPGRPPKARESALLAITYEIVNAQTWRQIVSRRVLDAVGKKQVIKPDGQSAIIDDERSTAQGRNIAATWIRDTVIGKPTEYVSLAPDDSAYEQFAAYTDEQIAEILATIERLRRDSCGGINTEGDSGAAEGTK